VLRKALILFAFVVFLPTLLTASGLEPGLPGLSIPGTAAICPAPPASSAVPMAPCKQSCDTGIQFSPQPRVVCTFTGVCQPGTNGCCESSCMCGDSTGLPGTPASACALDVPTDCCSQCTIDRFRARFGIVCTFADMCEPGVNGCCEYTCSCGKTDGLPPAPLNACALNLPTNCCPEGKAICPTHYCNDVGDACVAVGCGVGCCIFECGRSFPTCTGPDPIPPEAC